jgi:hypothetical protein
MARLRLCAVVDGVRVAARVGEDLQVLVGENLALPVLLHV